MLEQSVKFKYKANAVTGEYSFSALDNVITLPEYVAKLENPRVREAIKYEAEKARSYYINEVKELKTSKVKVNNFRTKREAVKRAREEAQQKYFDIWDEVEAAQKSARIYETSKSTPDTPPDSNHADKDIKYLVTVKDAGGVTQLALCEGAELTIRLTGVEINNSAC